MDGNESWENSKLGRPLALCPAQPSSATQKRHEGGSLSSSNIARPSSPLICPSIVPPTQWLAQPGGKGPHGVCLAGRTPDLSLSFSHLSLILPPKYLSNQNSFPHCPPPPTTLSAVGLLACLPRLAHPLEGATVTLVLSAFVPPSRA